MRLKTPPAAPDLKATAVAILLRGFGAHPPPAVPPSPSGFGSGMLELWRPGGMARLWRQHEAWLREQAAAWQWAPRCVGPDGTRRFYAEALVWEEARGEHHTHAHPHLHTDEADDAAE